VKPNTSSKPVNVVQYFIFELLTYNSDIQHFSGMVMHFHDSDKQF
jgi:hypothetical protein